MKVNPPLAAFFAFTLGLAFAGAQEPLSESSLKTAPQASSQTPPTVSEKKIVKLADGITLAVRNERQEPSRGGEIAELADSMTVKIGGFAIPLASGENVRYMANRFRGGTLARDWTVKIGGQEFTFTQGTFLGVGFERINEKAVTYYISDGVLKMPRQLKVYSWDLKINTPIRFLNPRGSIASVTLEEPQTIQVGKSSLALKNGTEIDFQPVPGTGGMEAHFNVTSRMKGFDAKRDGITFNYGQQTYHLTGGKLWFNETGDQVRITDASTFGPTQVTVKGKKRKFKKFSQMRFNEAGEVDEAGGI